MNVPGRANTKNTQKEEIPSMPHNYNACLFQMSTEEENVMEMTEFIFQDLKGGIPPSLMNGALPAGAIATNKKEMEYLK